jgi:hypothetical protein
MLLLVSCSQNSFNSVEEAASLTIPAAVTQALNSNFPEARATTWAVSGELYRAAFIDQEVHSGATFEKNGEMILDWHQIDEVHLPEAVKDYMKVNYMDAEITEVRKVNLHQDQGKGTVNFYVKMFYTNIIYSLEFKADGTLLSSKNEGRENERHSCND